MISNSDIVDGNTTSFVTPLQNILKVSALMFSAPLAGSVVLAALPLPSGGRSNGTNTNNTARTHSPVALPIMLNVNGCECSVRINNRTTLLDALRKTPAMKGTKKGCDDGQCGACTVLLGGRRINACLTLAAMCGDEAITTIEGLSNDNPPHPT